MNQAGGDLNFFSPEVKVSVRKKGKKLIREMKVGSRQTETVLETTGMPHSDPNELETVWWLEQLRGATISSRSCNESKIEIGMVDLFCGSGGFTQGLKMISEDLGIDLRVIAAVDLDGPGLQVYEANHKPEIVYHGSVTDLVEYSLDEYLRPPTVEAEEWTDEQWDEYDREQFDKFRGYIEPPEILEAGEKLGQLSGQIDLVIGGPPCQGHSNLNNHTRRADERNALYSVVPAIAHATGASVILIENVPGVVKDHGQVVGITEKLLQYEKWFTEQKVLTASKVGWPQTRKRHFLCAHKEKAGFDNYLTLEQAEEVFSHPTRPVSWVLEDLLGLKGQTTFDKPSEISEENKERIRILYEEMEGEYNLPDKYGPLSRQIKENTHKSVYGRMRADKPSGTITTGFLSIGRGRFMHPIEARSLTPHDGARIQGFPDSYQFEVGEKPPLRTHLSKWIGDAVPIPLGYTAGLAAISRFLG